MKLKLFAVAETEYYKTIYMFSLDIKCLRTIRNFLIMRTRDCNMWCFFRLF